MIKRMLLIFIAVLVLLFLISSPIIFQEGTPVPLAIGMAKLQITDESVVGIPGEIKREPLSFLPKTIKIWLSKVPCIQQNIEFIHLCNKT
ncbi:hypothetical protein MKZ02_22415 [Pseudobacillus sp. FSL P4-0506]|uniref:hypothetical protein n=1 Tax=Pseudobacillus sp. FSL P4-0506 TaxID=2921576 RepID=UPI0030F847BE